MRVVVVALLVKHDVQRGVLEIVQIAAINQKAVVLVITIVMVYA